MDFINAPVPVANLPKAEEVGLQPVQTHYRTILRIEWMITSVVLVIIALLLIYLLPHLRASGGWIPILLAVILINGSYYLLMERSFPYLKYAVRDHDVMVQRGWIIRRLRVCPFNRTQNCTVKSGPLERRYGLATLVIYTAGSEGADMSIPGLLQEEADNLRQFILSKIHRGNEERI